MPLRPGQAKLYLGLGRANDDFLARLKGREPPPPPPPPPLPPPPPPPVNLPGGSQRAIEAYTNPEVPPRFQPTPGKHWVRIRPYKVGEDPDTGLPIYGFWGEDDLPDEEKRLRTGIAQARLDFDKAEAALDNARLERKDAATLSILTGRLQQAKRQLDIKERALAEKIAVDEAKAKAAEAAAATKATLEDRMFNLKEREYFDRRARQSSADLALITRGQQGLQQAKLDFQRQLQEQAGAGRTSSALEEIFGPGYMQSDLKPWWYYLPGGPELRARLLRQRTENLEVPAGVANARWDPNLNKYVTTYGLERPRGPVEPVPSMNPAFGMTPGTPNPFVQHPLYGGLGITPGMPLTGEQRDEVRTRQVNMAARGNYIASQAEAERKAREEEERLSTVRALAPSLQNREPFWQR